MMSEHEGMPTVIWESLACGVPVISSNVGDVKEIINDTNGQIAVKSNFKKKVKFILNNKKSIRDECVKSVEKYKWEKVIKKMIIDYKK